MVDLLEGFLCGVVVFQFHYIYALRHEQSDIAAPFCHWVLCPDVGTECHKQGVEKRVIIVLILIATLQVVGCAGEERLQCLDEVLQVSASAKLLVCLKEAAFVAVHSLYRCYVAIQAVGKASPHLLIREAKGVVFKLAVVVKDGEITTLIEYG